MSASLSLPTKTARLKVSRPGFKLNVSSFCSMGALAVEADRAHNPKVVGSNPTPATKENEASQLALAFSFAPEESYNNIAMNNMVLTNSGIIRLCQRNGGVIYWFKSILGREVKICG